MNPLKSSDRLKLSLQQLLDEKLGKLRKLRPIAPTHLQKLKERFQIEMTYNSNAIEGNTLTLNETYWVFQEGITVKGKSLREHLEVKDHKKALERLYQLVESPSPIRLSESILKDLHHAVVELSEEQSGREYRDTKVLISGSQHTPLPYDEIPAAMKTLVRWVQDPPPDLHPIEFAAILHHRFVHIHPFLDGNGRTARLIMNLMLMKEGYPLVIILKNDRMKYYRALRSADSGRYKALIQFIAQAAIRSLNLYLEVLVSSREKPKFISLADATRYCDYSQEYLSKLAKEGRLDAHKQNRNWFTSKEAIEDYVKSHGQ